MLTFRPVSSCSTLNFFQLSDRRGTLINGVFCGSEVVEQYQYTERSGGKGMHGSYLSACEKPVMHETWQFFLSCCFHFGCMYLFGFDKNWTKYFLNLLGRFEKYSGLYLHLNSDLSRLFLFWFLEIIWIITVPHVCINAYWLHCLIHPFQSECSKCSEYNRRK